MDKIIDLKKAQANQVTLSAPVVLRKTPDGQTKAGEFEITAYTGAVVDRWWGKLAIEVDGIQAKDSMPIFREHSRDTVVGYSLSNKRENGAFVVSGKFSTVTDAAKEVQALAGEGFPWQASIGVQPLKILALEQGASAEVNGAMLEGPAEIWIESRVFETSFVALGADDNTQVACFSQVNETPAPAGNKYKEHDMDITMSLLKSKAPELLAQIRKDAAAEAFKKGEEAGRSAGARNAIVASGCVGGCGGASGVCGAEIREQGVRFDDPSRRIPRRSEEGEVQDTGHGWVLVPAQWRQVAEDEAQRR